MMGWLDDCFFSIQVKSDFDEVWCEWYESEGLQSYWADFEFLQKLFYVDERGQQNKTTELFQLRGSTLTP